MDLGRRAWRPPSIAAMGRGIPCLARGRVGALKLPRLQKESAPLISSDLEGLFLGGRMMLQGLVGPMFVSVCQII